MKATKQYNKYYIMSYLKRLRHFRPALYLKINEKIAQNNTQIFVRISLFEFFLQHKTDFYKDTGQGYNSQPL